MTAVLLATLINETQDARWTVASCALDGVLHAEAVGLAMRLLLPHPVISPARMVRAIEHEPRSLPALWPILTESIRHAGDVVRAGGTIPKWANRVLDLAQTVAPQLDQAASRGLAPADASLWPGLDALADSPGKSAAVTKARALRDRSRV
jgi:hypothetical protein